MNKGERTAIAPSQKFKIDCVERKHNVHDCITEGYAMAFWALLTLGGMGVRSRRGFGSLRLVSITSSWEKANHLKQYPKIETIEDWWNLLEEGLEITNDLFTNAHQNDHFHIGKGTRFLLLGSDNEKGFNSWFDALDRFGENLQTARDKMNPSEKAAIGLPIQGFRVKGKKSARGASPLSMRVVKVEDAYYNLVILSKSPTCKSNDILEIKKEKEQTRIHVDYGVIHSIWKCWRKVAFRDLEVR
jgi:CRISPR-associated protein Cmr1